MKAKYDSIGQHYNTTRRADPYLVGRLRHHLRPLENGKYLDIGCGTGNYTIALKKLGVDLIGVDPSEQMLGKARAKAKDIDWKNGTAEQVPLASASVDGVVASLTIHHWSSLELAFRELNWVLKPDGRFVLFTSTPEQMEGYWLNEYFPKMMTDSKMQMPSFEAVEENILAGGFQVVESEKYFVRPDLEDLFLYAGKNRPWLYLDKNIQRGISSFSALANASEVLAGLKKLEQDIGSGEIDNIIKKHDNDLGDYLFMVAEKIIN